MEKKLPSFHPLFLSPPPFPSYLERCKIRPTPRFLRPLPPLRTGLGEGREGGRERGRKVENEGEQWREGLRKRGREGRMEGGREGVRTCIGRAVDDQAKALAWLEECN